MLVTVSQFSVGHFYAFLKKLSLVLIFLIKRDNEISFRITSRFYNLFSVLDTSFKEFFENVLEFFLILNIKFTDSYFRFKTLSKCNIIFIAKEQLLRILACYEKLPNI